MDKKFVRVAKKARLAKLAIGAMAGMVFTTGIALNVSMHRDIGDNQKKVDALIQEVGDLTQANFELHEQVTSQDAVLKDIRDDFSQLGNALDSGDQKQIAALVNNLLKNFDAADQNQTVQLSEDDSTTTDTTEDILLLGTHGSLTDTLMIASINKEKKKISLFSVPRDLYINGRRINQYYTYYGVDTLKGMLEKVTGLTIEHYVQIDMAGFTKAIDLLGGVDITVDKAIYDGLYPNANGGYDPYSIAVGNYHMTGAEALKYARSRESTTDFDRAGRQQKILTAVREKLKQLDSIKEITQLCQTAFSYTKTDLNVLDGIGYYYDYRDFDLNTGLVLSTSNYLYSTINESGAYTLLPKGGSFAPIQKAISDLVN